MAYAAVSSATQNLGKILIEEGQFLYGVKGQLKEMETELKWMLGFLKDAEARKGESDVVRICASEIREVTYDVEDLIDGFNLKSALRNRKGVVNRIKKYSGLIYYPVELHQEGSRIEDIKDKLTSLKTRLRTYDIKELKVGGEEVVGASATRGRKREDYLHVPNHSVVGLDEKISELVEHLLDDQKEKSVVCLYGMGGLGKTTTAKQIYNNKEIKAYFKGFAWVYLSQKFNSKQVWESILTQLSRKNKKEVERMSTDELTSQLFQLQKEKRFLVVIDDIWRKQDWDILSPAFPYSEGDNKSKILLTSRNRDVVLSDWVYRTSLDILDDSCSLDLLKNTISSSSGGRDHPIKEDSKMQKYAGEMVKECGGLPLAIIVLGGILARKHDLHNWEKVGASIKSVMKRRKQEGKETSGVSSVLESSYEDLPYNLRSCFLYFSQYRENEEIKTTELKQKWIGEGFISSTMGEGDETMEDIAEVYLDDLVCRCMIQVGREGHKGRVKTCHMHDLMRDLCISKAQEEGFAHTIKPGAEKEGGNLKEGSFRRLCISSSSNNKLDEAFLSSLGKIFPQLRSIRFQDNLDDDQCEKTVKKLKSVRVLELPSTMGESGSKLIGNLIHLRFLSLQVSMLHSSICNLICLQTLNLEKCNSKLKIPDSVWRMVQLRHLYLPKDGGVCESEKQLVGDFQNLQTLVNFPPENFDLNQYMVIFINVRKLVITQRSYYIFIVLRRSPAMVFHRLKSLTFLVCSYQPEQADFEAVARSCPSLHRLVVDGTIKFPKAPSSSTVIWPSNLTKLVLKRSGLDERHMMSLGKLQSLKVLFLYGDAFRGEQMIFHGNYFQQLQHLLVEQLKNLKVWTVQEGGLPRLYCLEIVNCIQLKSVSDGFQYLKQLKELKVARMPYVFRKKLEKGGEDWERVRNVPSISFSHCYYREESILPGFYTSSNILDESESLELLKKTILFSGGPDHPIRENSKMDMCAIEMAKICGGVPTTISILGGILGRKHEIEEWESIKSVLKGGNEAVTSLLEFSYEDLPCNLKPCFLCFAQFEKDEEIKASEMIQRWIGEDFVKEDVVAEECLNKLVSRGLIQVWKRSHRSSGRVTICRMHEDVRHFCVSKAKEDGVPHSSGEIWSLDNPAFSSLNQLWNLQNLRERERIRNLDSTFLKLGRRSELPKSIGNLRCLQTLNLEKSGRDTMIPDWVWGMEQLRHLYLPKEGSNCESRRQQVGDFLNLQTLVNFPPRRFDLQQNLVKFTNVRKLVVIEKVEEMGTVLRSQDIMFNRLQSLSFMGRYTYRLQAEEEVDLEAFTRGSLLCLYRLVVDGSIKFPAAPSCTSIWPPNLTKLVLHSSFLDQSQLGSLAKLPNLQVLFLQWYAFEGKEMVFHPDDFPQLHHLKIEKLNDLETWDIHEGALPNLICLEIAGCEKLKSVPDGCQYLKQLKDLKVKYMSRRFTDRLEEGEEDWDRVSHVSSISCD